MHVGWLLFVLVMLTQAPAATLRGLVVDGQGRPLPNVLLSASRLGEDAEGKEPNEVRAARTSADGAFRIAGLHSGAIYLVTAALPGFAPVSLPVAIPKPGASGAGLRLVLTRGQTVLGQVVDERGRPVAGARVELAPGTAGRVAASALEDESGAPPEAKTGADGRFELRHLPTGWHRLRIEADGFLPLERDGVQVPASAARTNLGRLALERGVALHGWVGDPDGAPLSGAEVWILPAEVRDWDEVYEHGPAAISAADGTFVVRDLPREAAFGLDVCRAGSLPLSTTLREIPQEQFQAVLDPAAVIAGRVMVPGGAPVAAARIESWLNGEEPARSDSLRPCRRGTGIATTDAEGYFRLDSLPPGWWNLCATAGGYRAARIEQLHVLAGESRDNVEIVLGPGAIVSGRVSSARGEPAPFARVTAFSEEGPVETIAGSDGAYRLAGVEPGERTVEATLGEGTWASRSLIVQPGENRLDLTMDQGSPHQEIRGRVLSPEGGPLPGAAVLATGSDRTFSSADGSFTLRVEDNRVYELWAEKQGFAATRAGDAVRVAGEPVAGVEIRLRRGGSLTGRLLGLEREELAGASVEVELATPLNARAAVDPQGGYRIDDVPPGEWTVTARAGGRAVRDTVTLPPDTPEASVDLVFTPSQEVSGWIAGPDGEPVADAYIRFFAPGAPSGSTYSRSDGSFRLRLEDGTYRVVARRDGYLWTPQEEPVTVEGAPVSGIELRLDEAAVLRGRILGLQPGERAKAVWAATDAPNTGRREGRLDQEGGFVIPDLPPGDWTVTVLHQDREVSVSIHLPAGQKEEWVEIELGGS